MKLFSCPNCGNRLYFENATCLACGSSVVYDPLAAGFSLTGNDSFRCLNASECGCNWRAEAEGDFCLACRLNKTIPDLSIDGNRERWTRVEAAKKRAVYTLLAFGLAVGPKQNEGDEEGLAFDFLADPAGGERVLTGHDNGLITLNVAEADSAEREKMRSAMGEPYRTLLGHFRHELGHYYWDRLIRNDAQRLVQFRALFGDESRDYAAALQAHYDNGPPADWQANHISAYAASHPWEDWAETWAHYLHITDTLEMVDALNIPLGQMNTAEHPSLAGGDAFDVALSRWLAISEASNALNRCMGLPDLYPFVITPGVAGKLHFVDSVLHGR